MDIINEKLHNIKVMGISTRFSWVPAHVGVDGNEKVAILAKQTLGIKQVDFQVPLSKAEAKVLICTISMAGVHLYNIQKQVGAGRKESRNQVS